MEIQVHPDCGNAPKKRILRDAVMAFARREEEALLTLLADDVEWRLVGHHEARGKERVAEMLRTVWSKPVRRLSLDTILTHGDEGSVSGSATLVGRMVVHFSDVYKFSSHARNAKVAAVTSYWIRG